jgi:transposase
LVVPDVASSSAGAALVLAAQVDNLDQGFVGREVPAVAGRATQLAVDALNHVGRVDDLADLRREVEERATSSQPRMLFWREVALMGKYRKYTPEYRQEAVRLVVESGRPTAEVARELGIHEGTLGNWVSKYRSEHPVSEELNLPERARLRELERENRELRPAGGVPEKSSHAAGGATR